MVVAAGRGGCIEAALRWAYQSELPKRQSDCTWDTMFGSASWRLGTRVDNSSTGESFPVAAGPPHPDALLLDHAVGCLPEQVRLRWPDLARQLLGDLAVYLGPVEVASHRWSVRQVSERSARVARDRSVSLAPGLTVDLIELVRLHARLGTRPVWDVGPIRLVRVNAANNQPAVMVGRGDERRVARSPRRGVYETGAHGMLRLEPTALEILSARFEYAVWREALVALAAAPRKYGGITPAPPLAAAAPWVVDDEPRGQVFRTDSPGVRRSKSSPGEQA